MKELELKGLSEQDTARIGEKLGEGLFITEQKKAERGRLFRR